MNHAFLIQVHAYPQLLLKIIERLNAPNHYFFIHIDKKSKSIFHSSIIEAIKLTDNVTIISDYKVNWGGRSQFVVTISLMRLALSHPVKMDYFHLISGQDFPLRSNQVFDRFFEKQSVAGYMGLSLIHI